MTLQSQPEIRNLKMLKFLFQILISQTVVKNTNFFLLNTIQSTLSCLTLMRMTGGKNDYDQY